MADGRVIVEAILDTANVSKNVKNLKNELGGISWDNITSGDDKAKSLGNAFKSAGTACTMSLTAPIVAAGTAAFTVASEYEGATSRIQAAFGTTREEAEHFKEIGATIYEGGWGQSMDEVTSALIQTKSTIRDIDDTGLQTVTQNALMLSQTFGADVNETIRGTNALMSGFGLSATEATDLMTAGMQRGLNFTNELGDNLAEYSGRWGEAGMSASQYFSLLEAGASNGAYSLDKVGDFLNEFLTSLSDGRMEESISKFSQGTQDVFAAYQLGGASAQDVLNAVIGEMSNMTNETDRAALASTLWSSLGEDNAMGMITALAGVEDTYGDVAGTAQAAGDAASESFGVKSQEAIRKLQGALEPFGEPLVNIASMVADVASAFGSWLSSLPAPAQQAIFIIAAIVAAIGPVLSLIGTVVTVMPTLSAAVTAAAGAFRALGAAMAANPIGVVVTIIGVLVAAFIYLWNTSEEFRNFWIGLWNTVSSAVMGVVNYIGSVIIPSIVSFFTGLGETISTIWNNIVMAIQTAINNIVLFFTGLGATINSVWNSIVLGVQTAINTIVMIFTTIGMTISTIWNNIVMIIQNAIMLIYTGITTYLNFIIGFWTGIWNSVWSVVSSVWNGILSTISGIINGISSTISGVFNAIKGTVTSIWNGIKQAIESPMNSARDIVKGIIDTIKGFFNFSISWPHIPLPHFSISPAGWQVGDLLEGKIPTLGIEWYATGGVFNGASIIGVGEAGPEAVVPLRGRNMRPFAEAVAGNMQSDTQTATEIRALRKELPRLFEKYTLRSLVVNGREFARLVVDTEGLY